MNINPAFQKYLTTLLLLVIAGLQIMLLSQFSNRVSQQDLSKIETQLVSVQQELNNLLIAQSYITTPGGVAVNISKNDIEQAVAMAVKEALPEVLANKRNASPQVTGQTSIVENPLTPQQEQNRFQAQQTVNQVIDNAILMGHWTKQDTDDLLPHMGNLSVAQRNELIKKFTDAISSNRIQLDVPPPPL